MLKRFLQLAIILGSLTAFAQTPIAQMSNSVPICSESQACVITAVSDPNARFQFGTGTTWCQTFNTPKVPFTVTSANPVCSFNPAPSSDKTLVGQQRNTTYYVTYTLAGVTQPIKTIPGLLSPSGPPTAISTFPAICTNYSDATFVCTATGPVTQVTK